MQFLYRLWSPTEEGYGQHECAPGDQRQTVLRTRHLSSSIRITAMQRFWRIFGIVVRWLLWVAALAPLAVWVSILIEAILAWRILGRWPSYDTPDPKLIPHFQQSLRIASVMSGVLWFTAAGGAIYSSSRLTAIRQFVAAGVGLIVLWAIAYALLAFDPGGIVEWAFD